MQVGIIKKDQPSIRFIWPSNQSVEQLQQTHLNSGARYSLPTANIVLQKTAANFAPDQTIHNLFKNSFYLHDFVISFETVEIAQEAAVLMKTTIMRAGFNLTKLVSNEQAALENVNDSDENNENIAYLASNGVSRLKNFQSENSKVQYQRRELHCLKTLYPNSMPF